MAIICKNGQMNRNDKYVIQRFHVLYVKFKKTRSYCLNKRLLEPCRDKMVLITEENSQIFILNEAKILY